MHLRLAIIIAVLIGSALLLPAAFFAILIGLDGLRGAVANPNGAIFLLPDFAFLLLGLGAVAGPIGVLGALLAQKSYFRAHLLLRTAVTVALLWGILAAACAGGLLTLSTMLSGVTRPSSEWLTGPLAVALAIVGAMVLRFHRREA